MPGGNGGSVRAQPDAPAPAKAGRWSDLKVRLLSALVLLPIALGSEWAGGGAWAVLVALAGAGMAWEWARMFGKRLTALPGLAVLCGVVFSTLAVAVPLPGLAAAALVGGMRGAWARGTPGLAAGVPAIAAACIALVWLRGDPVAGQENILFLLFVVWASDIGAYAVGRLVGGPKLAPAISPGKTWSGAAGGLAVAALVGEAAAQAMHPAPLGHAAAVAAVLGVASQLGDLGESALKRWAGVKDSSRMIPGHGGLLDRLDGVLAAAPVAALLAAWMGRGTFLWQ